MASGLMYLVLLTAVADKSPELAPVCGGEFVPGFETELDLYRGMITINDEGGNHQVQQTAGEGRQGRVPG